MPCQKKWLCRFYYFIYIYINTHYFITNIDNSIFYKYTKLYIYIYIYILTLFISIHMTHTLYLVTYTRTIYIYIYHTIYIYIYILSSLYSPASTLIFNVMSTCLKLFFVQSFFFNTILSNRNRRVRTLAAVLRSL